MAVAIMVLAAVPVALLSLTFDIDSSNSVSLDAFNWPVKVQARVLGESTTAARVGQLVYNTGDRTVYLVGQKGLYGFPNLATFNSWGYSFSQVLPANSAELALQMIGLVPSKNPSCGNPLDQIVGTCGSNSSLVALPNSSTARVGQLVYKEGSTIYLVGQSGLYGIPSLEVFNSWGWSFANMLPANSAEMAMSQVGIVPSRNPYCSSVFDQIAGKCGQNTTETARANQLINKNGTIYLVSSNGLYGIPTVDIFNSWGWTFSQVVPANSAETVLPQIGVVPYKNINCSSAIDQITGKCGQNMNATTITAPVITGPTSVKVGELQAYTFTSTSPYGSLNYSIDWGDGSAPSLGSNFISGSPCTQYHKWTSAGIYTVTATVTDANKGTAKNTLNVKVSDYPSSLPSTFQLSQNSFEFTANQGDTANQQQSMVFVNISSQPVNFQLVLDNQPSWLNGTYNKDVMTANPNVQNGLGASVNPAGLSVGKYTTYIKITGNFAGSPVIIPVNLTINPSSTNSVPATLSINDFSLPVATVGQSYASNAITFSQTGNSSIKVSFTGLPSGIGIPALGGTASVISETTYSMPSQLNTITLAGVPTQAGTYSVTLTLNNNNGLIRTQQFNLVVNPQSSLSVSPSSLTFTATAGGDYPNSQSIYINPGSATTAWQASAGPGIFNLDLSGGTVCGTGVTICGTGPATVTVFMAYPYTAGTYNANITVTAGGQSKIIPVTLTVTAAASLSITTNSLPAATVGQAYAGTVAFTYNGNKTVNVSVSGLPSGMQAPSYIGNTGAIGGSVVNFLGAPAAAGTYSITVSLNDGAGASASKSYTLKVNPALTASLIANGQKNITVNAGDYISYEWRSTGAVSASSTYTANKADACPGGVFAAGEIKPWVASTLSGGVTAQVQSCQRGVTYTINYRVVGADGQMAAADPVIISVR